MITINFYTVEDLIFYDNQVQILLPEFKHLFDSWKFSIKCPSFRSLGKRAIVDLLNYLSEDHIKILSKYFGDAINIDRMDYHIVKHFVCDIQSIDMQNSFPNLALYRKGEHLYISTWR